MIAAFGAHRPAIDPTAYVVESAVVIGDVVLGAGASIWFYAVVRGDVERIRIGAGTNIQDHATRIPPRSLVVGRPGKRTRELSADEVAYLHRSASGYVAHAAAYRAQGLR